MTDGRLSGASGKVPAAIHVWPEAIAQGPIARLRDGDLLHLDAAQGCLELRVAEEDWAARVPAPVPLAPAGADSGRALLGWARRLAGDAERGGMIADPFGDATHEGEPS